MTAVATAASIGSWTAALAAGALVLAAASTFLAQRPRVVGAAIGALSATALLTLPTQGPFGTSAVVAVVAVAPVVWAGYQRSPRRVRRMMRRTAGWGICALVLCAIVLGVASALAARPFVNGVDSATTGLDLVRDGEQTAGAAAFSESQDSFDSAERLLSGPLAWPAQIVPVLSQHARAMSAAAHTGSELASSAEVAASVAPYRDLKARDGEVDLDAVVAMQEPVAAAAAALRAAEGDIDEVRSPWLVPPVIEALDRLQSEVDAARPETEIASRALQVVPGLLGGEGDRRYLVLFTSPAESRNLGGFAGSYGVLEASDGEVDITVSGSISELARSFDHRERNIIGEDEFLTRYSRYQPERFFQNLTASPDMETTANVTAQMFLQTTGDPLDGVIVADPFALQALLALTGPVDVEGMDERLTEDNAAQFLLLDQYVLYEDERDERKDRLEAAGRATFDALTERELPAPRVVGRVLGPIVDQKRLLFFPFEADEQELIEELGALGRMEAPARSDFLSVRSANLRPNKIDTFVHRDVSYDATYDPVTGQVDATVTVRFRNEAPASGLPPYVIGPADSLYPLGTARVFAGIYTPLGAEGAMIDGQPVGLEPQTEVGLNVFSTTVQIPAGGEATLVVELTGTIEGMGDRYRLDASSQPLVTPDSLAVSVQGPAGGAAVVRAPGMRVDDGVASSDGEWITDRRYAVIFDG